MQPGYVFWMKKSSGALILTVEFSHKDVIKAFCEYANYFVLHKHTTYVESRPDADNAFFKNIISA